MAGSTKRNDVPGHITDDVSVLLEMKDSKIRILEEQVWGVSWLTTVVLLQKSPTRYYSSITWLSIAVRCVTFFCEFCVVASDLVRLWLHLRLI